MPKKLAITIAGAVSLGSYEAGVLYEVLDAIAQHNKDARTTDDDRIVVDVLTGASAGGMTAVILAQKLLFNGDEFDEPYQNPLYHAWVERISLENLQNTQTGELAMHSIFSSDLIEAISQETLMARYQQDLAPAQKRHVAAGDAIRVGVALTNLNGVGYQYQVVPGGEFAYLDYGDQRTRLAEAATCDTAAFWEPMRQAAVACGAFPFAFRTRDMQRSAKAEPDDYPVENRVPWAQDPTMFTYSDGGILQNQPLGMAKNLVDLIDKHLNQEKRFYLFVSPSANDPQANDSFREAIADYVHLIQRLVDVVMGQAGFQDWITANGVNERVALLDSRADGLRDAMLAGEIDAPALAKTAESLLKLFFPDGTHLAPGSTGPETLDAAKNRIAAQYAGEMAALGANGATFRDAVLAFETAAGLGARDLMTIYGVTASNSELAGAGLQAFLGFFDQIFRDHDYDVGRQKAQAVLAHPDLQKAGAIGPIRYAPKDVRPIDQRLDGLKLSAVPHADLEEFKAGMRSRVRQMARELLGPIVSLPADPVLELIVNGLLDLLIKKS